MKNVSIQYAIADLCLSPKPVGNLTGTKTKKSFPCWRSIYFFLLIVLFSNPLIVSSQCTVGCGQSTTSDAMPGTNNFSNTFCIATASTLNYTQNFDMNGGTVCVGPNVTFSASGGNYNGNWTINNYGNFSRNLSLNAGQTFNNYGTFTGSLSLNGGTVVNYNGASITPSSFSFNGGSFTNNSGGSASFGSSFTVNSGATFTNNGTLSVPGISLNSSAIVTLGGTTNINGDINNNGTINISGLVTVTGNFNQNSSGSLVSQAGAQCNTLNTTGTIQGQGTYNGTNSLLLNKTLSPSCPSCLVNGTSTTPPGQPVNQISGAALTASANSISGNITNPGGSPAATHYIVLRRFGTAVSDQPSNYINYTVGNIIGNSVVVAVNAISTLSFTDANTIAINGCGTYHYAVFPYNASGNCGTYNRTVGAINRSSITVSSTAGTVGTSKSVCSGSNSGLLTLTGYTGSIVRWESSVSPFSSWTTIATTAATYTSGALTQTTQFRAIVNAGSGCSNATAAAATITVNSVPAVPTGTGATRCGNGALTLTATPGAGETIDWYAAASGGSALLTGNNSYTTTALSSTTIYYAEARNTTSGCAAPSRTAVTATVNPSPSVTLANFSPVCSGTTSVNLNYSNPANSPDQYSIDWSSAANAAGMTDISWTTLSGGTIPVTGLISTAGSYAASILVRNSSTGCQADASNGSFVTCGTATENTSLTLTATGVFTAINFASYGTPTGTCGSFATSACHASTSLSVVQTAALGNSSFTLAANNSTFGDPCNGTTKRLYIEAVSIAQILDIYAIPTVASVTGASICGTGTVSLSATASSGATIDWYAASSGGTALITASTGFTTPSINATTNYYAEARNTTAGCLSSSRTAVTATVNTLPAAPTGSGNIRCGNGTVTLTAIPAAGETIDWYAASSGGTALATASNSYTTTSLSATTIYYAAARNTTTGCMSAARTAVTATINPSPSVTLSNFTAVCSGTSSTTLTYSGAANSPDQYMIDWSNAANTAGLNDVSWTTLSGGNITVSGLIGTAGSYACNIYVRNSSTGCQADVSNGSAVTCGTANENGSITLAAASGVFSGINFASYGTPTGSCGSFSTGACHAANSLTVVQNAALGNNSFTIAASNGTFGDPCSGTVKRLYIEAVSTIQVLTINAAPTVTTSAGASRCDAGTLSLSATPSAGATIDWYAASSGGTALSAGSSTFTTPSLSATTIYYSGARNTTTGCTTIARTTVTATINNAPAAPGVSGSSRCGNGTLTLTATPGSGEAIDWYAASSGGTALATGSNSYTTPSLSSTTIYYVVARNTTTGCATPVRTSVTATINPVPFITLSNFPAVCSGTTSTLLNYSSPVNSPDQYMIDWSNAANTAGMIDVSWSTLSGGTISVSGLTTTAGSYSANILVRNSATGCQADVSNNNVITCGTASEHGSITLTAPSGGLFTAINFASYGTPGGSCGAFTTSACHSATSLTVVQNAALGRNSFTIAAENALFGDPCSGTTKRLYIEAVSNAQVLTIGGAATITASFGTTRCGTGSVTISATPSSGAAIDWYAATSGGTALATGTNSYTSSISTTTTYYAEARNTTSGCLSPRSAVTATVTVPVISSFTPAIAGPGMPVVITGTNFTGATAVSFGGTAAASYTVNSATQITAVVGAGATGNVSVTTACGTTTLPGFSFYPAPTITSFTPISGYIGNTITITGTNFTGATVVSFGGTAAASFTVVSATSITAVLNTGAAGSVAVTTPGGTATRTGFTYIQATVWAGTMNNNWNTSGNWNNGIPTSSSLVVIPPVETYPALSASQTISSLSMDTSTALNITGSNTLTVTGNINNSGTVSGTGKITMGGSSAQTISGNGTFTNVTINNGAGVSVSSGSSNKMNITGSLSPTTGTLTTNGNLVLKSTASGTAMVAQGSSSGNYISGTVTFERYIPARRAWRMISYPFNTSGAPTINASIQEGAGGNASTNPNPNYGTHITGGSTANGFDANPTGNASMKELSGTNWIGISSTSQTITAKPGYFIFVRGSRANNLSLGVNAPVDNTTLRGVGNIKQGNQSLSVTGSGWQILGNPFPAPVNLLAMATTNSSVINNNFKFWDPKLGGSNNVGGYVTASYNGSTYDYAPTPTSNISEFVQSGAAFFVDAKAAGSIAVNEAHKAAGGSDNVFRPSSPTSIQKKLYINLKSVNNDGTKPVVDGVMVGYDENFDDNINELDATKLPINTNENLSVKRNNVFLSIERRKEFTSADTIYLNMNYLKVKSYQLELNAAAFDAGIFTAYLEDDETGSSTILDLTGNTLYNFAINLNSNINRFRIVFKRNNLVVLPVTITSINAIKQGNNILVDWKVQQELNVASYEIEKSADGIHFIKVAEKNAANTSAYNWLDETVFSGMNYYRLKIIDRDGRFKYSTVVYVSINKKEAISIFPNPVENNTVQLMMTGQPKGNYRLNIYNSNGQHICSNEFYFNGMDATKATTVSTVLPQGLYNAEITSTGGKKTTIQFSVQ